MSHGFASSSSRAFSAYEDVFTATTSQTAFVLSSIPASVVSTILSIDGVMQNKNCFTLAGNTLTYTGSDLAGGEIVTIKYTYSILYATSHFSAVEDIFTATASQTVFTLSETPPNKESIILIIDAAVSAKDQFTLSGSTLTLTSGLVGGEKVVVKYNSQVAITTDSNAIHDNVASEISALTEKTALHANDLFLIEDSENSNSKKKVKLSTITGITATKTADYTITDDDTIRTLFVDPSARAITITLPTLADNLGRTIDIKVIAAGGAVTLAGEGAETIDGVTTFVMQSSGDHCTVVAQTTGWRISSAKQSIDTGWIKRNAWTNEHLGNANCIYDGKSGTFTIGEIVTEYTDAGYTTPSGVSGIIMADSGTVLTIKNVAGVGNWTNDYYIKGGTSLATARPNGSSIGVDTNVTHNFGKSISALTSIHNDTSSDKSEATIIRKDSYNYANEGVNYWGVNTNNILVQTGSAAYGYLAANGVGTATGANWYYRIVIEVII